MPLGSSKRGAPYADEADYVVVGSGSSGAAIAGRLAESGASVIVVEAGKSDEQFLVKKPGMIGPMHSVPEIKKKVDWGFYSVPQKHLLDRKMPVPRGKVVGGSSSINGMVYVRGNRANYDSWAAEGNTGWDADTVNAAYLRMEDFEDGANDYRGAGGPIKVTRNKTPQEGSLQFIQAASDTLGAKILDDYNAESQEGVSRMQQNAAAGLRYSASPRLHPSPQARRPRAPERDAHDQDRDRERPRGRHRGHRHLEEGRRREADHPGRQGGHPLRRLRRLGPAPDAVRHRPRPAPARPRHRRRRGPAGRRQPARPPLPRADLPHHDLEDARHAALLRPGAWPRRSLRPGKSFLANTVFEAVAFMRTSLATDVPDLQLHLLPWSYVSPNQDEPIRHDVDPRPSITILSTLIYPRSRGTLRLANTDPTAAPLIDFQYLADPDDLEVLAEGSEMVREIMAGAAFGGAVKEELHPGTSLKGQELRDAILNRATSVYHGVGTCRMGVDELAVVGPDLKVRGIDGLRVCDASIMPSITGGNTNAPAIMIGERGADLVLGRN